MDNKSYLNSLPDNITELDVSNRGLTSLDVTRFKNLKILYCHHNQLTSLHLNDNLEMLDCYQNRLTSLHLNQNLQILACPDNLLTSLHLNENLQQLNCNCNQLTSLHLNEKLQIIHYYYNPVYEIIGDTEYNNLHKIKQKMRILNNFRYLYYCLKFKKRFRDLLWVKIREPKIRKKYSHANLLEHLHEDTDLEELLNNW